MRKLNTHSVYDLAEQVHPLTDLSHSDDMTLGNIFWSLYTARMGLIWFAQNDLSFFSPSLKRAASALIESIQDIGFPEKLPWEGGSADAYDPKAAIQEWQVDRLTQAAKNFETVLANELPGLAIYYVLQKGIYSTDDLLMRAHYGVPDTVRAHLPAKASQDICESGKCLAFELATASAFHMWRALETVMDAYHQSLTGKSFEDAGVSRNWGVYIKALEKASAQKRITTFLDHIREEYRNPISHPSETLETEEAFSLFSAGLSAITQAMKATMAESEKRRALAKAATAALSAAAP